MGRRSGGLLLLIRKQLEPFVERITLPYDHLVGVKLSKELIKSNGDVILIGAYVPPKGSPFYRNMDSNCHISVLENCLLDILVQYPGAHIICCGDFNARTANVQVDPAPNDESVPCSDIHRPTLIFVENRVSRDMTVNEFGEAFLNLCACFDLYILNGFKLGDKAGELTNISNHGCSFVDYCAVAEDFIGNIVRLCVCERIESQPMPLLFEISAAIPTHSAPTPVLTEKTCMAKRQSRRTIVLC